MLLVGVLDGSDVPRAVSAICSTPELVRRVATDSNCVTAAVFVYTHYVSRRWDAVCKIRGLGELAIEFQIPNRRLARLDG